MTGVLIHAPFNWVVPLVPVFVVWVVALAWFLHPVHRSYKRGAVFLSIVSLFIVFTFFGFHQYEKDKQEFIAMELSHHYNVHLESFKGEYFFVKNELMYPVEIVRVKDDWWGLRLEGEDEEFRLNDVPNLSSK